MRVAVATLADVWAHALAKNWHPPRHEYCRLVSEALSGRVAAGFCSREPGAALMIGGVFHPSAGAPGTVWLSVLPAMSGQMVRGVLVMRRMIRGADAPWGLVCHVVDTNDQGARMARSLGFVPTASFCGPLREWVHGRADRQDRKETIQSRA